MNQEWLEEQLSKALAEIEELKDIISELLPIDQNSDRCIGCIREKLGWGVLLKRNGGIHENGSLCLEHQYYDKAKKVLEIE